MTDFGTDPLFKDHERLETSSRPIVEITEDNLVDVAKALGMTLDFSGAEPVMRAPAGPNGYKPRDMRVGDWVSDEGISQLRYKWSPAGTYKRTEDAS